MNKEWSLDVIFQGFDDPEYEKTIKNLQENIDLAKIYAEELEALDQSKQTLEEQVKNVKKIIEIQEKIQVLVENLFNYASLKTEANTMDAQAGAQLSRVSQMYAEVSAPYTKMKAYIASLETLQQVIEADEVLKEYEYLLTNIQKDAKHMLSSEVEEVMAKLNESSAGAWEKMHSYLTSTVKVPYEGKTETLSSIRNKAYETSRGVRKSAYEAEIKAYDKVKDAIAFSLNSIKMQNITVTKLRGFTSPLERTLYESRMDRTTLDAMFSAIDEYLPKFHAYLKCKAKKLGYENGLPWYEIYAPMGTEGRTFTAEEAGEYLISHFEKFDTDLSDMIRRAFEEQWIDFYPREGKVGGAFCAELPPQKESRILTNFAGSFGDVVTLAHELGHAFHNLNLVSNRPLNNEISMQLAETASTFNENVITAAAIAEATTKEEKLHLIENQLQDATQVICDIYSRYLFETAVFEKRPNEFLYADDLCALMVEAQKKAFADGLEEATLHPYMWLCKGHYYSASLSFYNFPYAFGALFARGLYVNYQKQGKPFIQKYRKMLEKTPLMCAEDAAKIVGVDLRTKDFWREALQSFSDEIDEFIALCEA